MANGNVSLNGDSQGKVDAPGNADLGDGQSPRKKEKVDSHSPIAFVQLFHTKKKDAGNNVDEIEDGQGEHQSVEVLLQMLAGENSNGR